MSSKMRKWILVGAVALLAVILLACKIDIGEKETVVTPEPPTPTPIPPTFTPEPPTPTPVPDAKPAIVSVSLCNGLTEDGRPFAETNTYTQIDPFFVSIQVANIKPANIVSVHWYQEDTLVGLTEKDNVSGDTYVGLMLEPQGQWVPGNYKLEVSLDGSLEESQDFSVIGMADLPGPGGGGGKGGDTVEWQTYREANLGFSIDYPGAWLVEAGGSAVQFSHPQDTAMALVLVNAKPAGTSEQEAEAVYAALSQKMSNAQKSTSKPQKNGWHGISFVYTNDGADVVGVLLTNVVGSRGYSLLFVVVREQWDNIVPILEQMFASFQTSGDGGGDPGGAGEVLIEGKVVDSDTGRGIPNAVFVILKEGVTIKQFVDSGNDEALVYDAAQSGDDGAFKMNVPVKRGASYDVFAVANGYKPVVDTMTVHDQATNPWEVTVTMQKE